MKEKRIQIPDNVLANLKQDHAILQGLQNQLQMKQDEIRKQYIAFLSHHKVDEKDQCVIDFDKGEFVITKPK